ncbi:MAG: OsmC family protein [Bacteroidetes bacterium]|nr:OsmC family protein [Bacteroidota bacterium]
MKIFFPGNKKVFADFNGFTIKTDQSRQGGGDAEYPEPFTLFLASLGTCAGIFTKAFCDQRGIPADDITLDQEQSYNPVKRLIDKINITINVPSSFPEKYDNALIQTASLCSVKKHLKDEIEVSVTINRKK